MHSHRCRGSHRMHRGAPVKEDERRLATAVRLFCRPYNEGSPQLGDVARWFAWQIGMHSKRRHYLLDKWASKGWIEYGVSIRYPWLRPEGVEALERRTISAS